MVAGGTATEPVEPGYWGGDCNGGEYGGGGDDGVTGVWPKLGVDGEDRPSLGCG